MRSDKQGKGPMFQVVLYQPEIPPNTGAAMRLCAATNSSLHLIEPLGFSLTNRSLKRAGMDYRKRAVCQQHKTWQEFLHYITKEHGQKNRERVFAITTRGRKPYDQEQFISGDCFVFGPETRGLPDEILNEFHPHRRLRIPMVAAERSLNISVAIAIVVYEALRQQGFTNME